MTRSSEYQVLEKQLIACFFVLLSTSTPWM